MALLAAQDTFSDSHALRSIPLPLSPISGERGEGVAILLVEQNARATLNLSCEIYVVENGRVVAQGPSQHF